MAKIISQETFNDVVKENIEELDMTEDEAVEDAVGQFKAQGVNLSNIIKKPSCVYNIINRVSHLKELSEKQPAEDELISALDNVADAINGEISYKLLAAEKGAYSCLISCVRNSNNLVQKHALQALTTLMDGYPDLLEADGLAVMQELLSEATSAENLVAALEWLVVAVRKHEKTRAALIRFHVAKKLSSLAQQHSKNKNVVTAICSATQVLIMDDDVRVVHGDAHEHARALATELLPLFANLLSQFIEDEKLTRNLLNSLNSMIVRNEFCILLNESEGLKYVLDIMVEHPNNEQVLRECLLLLKGLAGSDEVKELIISGGAAPLVVSSLDKHYKSSNFAVAACMCIAALSLRSPKNSREIAAAGGIETLVRCLFHWKQNGSIMKHGCAAVRNQLSRCPDLKEEYKNLQLDQLILEAKQIHGDLAFEAKKVLLDLGCDIKLNEEWKGTGIQLQN